jgi:hypothetical protein
VIRFFLCFLFFCKLKATVRLEFIAEWVQCLDQTLWVTHLLGEWCRKFRDGRPDVHDEDSQGRPSLGTTLCNTLTHWFASDVVTLSLNFHWNSRNFLERFCRKLSQKKSGYHKFCARWALSSEAETFFDVGVSETRVTLWQVLQFRGWLCREVAYVCS